MSNVISLSITSGNQPLSFSPIEIPLQAILPPVDRQAAEEEVNANDNQDRRNDLHVSALVRNDVHVSAPVRNDLHVFAPVRNDVHVSAPVRNDLHVFAPVRNDVHVFAPAAEDVSSSTAITPRLDVAGGHQVQVILLRQAVIPSN